MPRRPRIDLPGVPQHVVQRGNDRQPCFFREDDYARYLHDLRELSLARECRVHAYVLMTNHVHLLLTPAAAGDIGRLMQALGRRYVRYVNDRYRRSGTLWEGRFKSSLVTGDDYLLRCQRYIELNPVRARMVADPGEYRWSSHRSTGLHGRDALVIPHAGWHTLGETDALRRDRCRQLVLEAVTAEETEAVRHHLQRQQLYGSHRFRRAIQAQLGRPLGRPGKPGPPRKVQNPAPVPEYQRETAL